jgi:hypothetical protein
LIGNWDIPYWTKNQLGLVVQFVTALLADHFEVAQDPGEHNFLFHECKPLTNTVSVFRSKTSSASDSVFRSTRLNPSSPFLLTERHSDGSPSPLIRLRSFFFRELAAQPDCSKALLDGKGGF